MIKARVTHTKNALCIDGYNRAADVTMLSAVKVYGRRTLGVVMTGMGKDGTAGALAIKRAEGKTCAQGQQTCVIYGMPKSAIDAGAIDEVVPLADPAPRARGAARGSGAPAAVRAARRAGRRARARRRRRGRHARVRPDAARAVSRPGHRRARRG